MYPVLSFDQVICPHLLKIRPDCKDNRKPKKAKRIKADLEVAEDKADPTDFTPAARPNSEPQSFISFLLAALLSSVPIFTVVYLVTFGCGGYYPCGGNFGFCGGPKMVSWPAVTQQELIPVSQIHHGHGMRVKSTVDWQSCCGD